MTFRRFSLLIAAVIFSASVTFCQTIERVSFDAKDSTDGYYLAIQPQSKTIKGAVVQKCFLSEWIAEQTISVSCS